tara:strand:- start:558 stop:1973 length:1416 start_codon:yes stop_codon:yes gene_type:complete
MKKRKLFLIGLLIWNFNSVFAQNFCSTPSTSSNLSLNFSYQMKSSNNNSYCLKIYFHIIRRSDGTGGQTNDSVNEAFDILNQDFNPHNISFNWDNQIDYIDNTSYYNNPNHGLTSTTPPTIFSVNNHQDGIDIYLYDDSVGGSGLANGVGESSEFYITGSYWKAPYNSFIKSHVISHEMGHVLYLWHTHHGTYNEGGNDNPCPELVNGSNSATCGDYVTDTPADPHLQFDVNQSTCQWNSSGTDANGNPYNPDEKNVMSYTNINCMEYFTTGQGERMRNAISTLPYLQQTVSDNCIVQKLSSIEQLCYDNSKTIQLNNNQNNPVSWQVSSNVTILTSNNNSITVRASSSNSTGDGWVKATLSNGIILQEDFNVGIPSNYLQTGEIESLFVDIFQRRWTRLFLHNVEEINGWEWQLNYSTIRPSTSIMILIYPNVSGYITAKVRRSNECGCGNWLSKNFNVISSSRGRFLRD